MENPLAKDLDEILAHTEGLWDELRGERLFITGGTGFFGCWLLESFAWANDRLGLGASAVVLTRNPLAFQRKAPHLAEHSAVRLHVGDVRHFESPAGQFSHIVHAATVSSSGQDEQEPMAVFDTIVGGTRRTLDFASKCGAKKLLLTSSGAVYGRQPPECASLREEYTGAPDPVSDGSAYGEGKRAAELLCALYARRYGIEVKIARCFAFVGPYLPLDRHFAVGNFIRDLLNGDPIRVNGDGTPFRSYLYAADLAIWLWRILFLGRPVSPYNVGSEEAISIRELAYTISTRAKPAVEVVVAGKPEPGVLPNRYVPSTRKAREELGLVQVTPLSAAIDRTVAWHSRVGSET